MTFAFMSYSSWDGETEDGEKGEEEEGGGGGGRKAKGARARGVEVFYLVPSVTRLISWVLLSRGFLRVSYGRH